MFPNLCCHQLKSTEILPNHFFANYVANYIANYGSVFEYTSFPYTVGLFVQIGFCFSTENLSNHDLVWNIVVTIFAFFGIFVHGFLIRAYYEMKKLEKKRGSLSRIVICMRPWILYSAAVLIIMVSCPLAKG